MDSLLKLRLFVSKPEYRIGDLVYLLTDPDQYQRMVTGVMELPETYLYRLSCGTEETDHWGIEISFDKNIMLDV